MSYFRRPWTARIASRSAAHPWKAMLAWTVFVVALFGAGTAMGTSQTEFEDFWVGEAGQAEELAVESGIPSQSVEKILITGDDVKTHEAAAAITDIKSEMDSLSEVSEVSAPRYAPDSTAALLQVTMSMPDHEAAEHVDPLLDATATVNDRHDGFEVTQTGDKSIEQQLDSQLGSDLARAEAFTLPVTLVILLLVFGSLLAAGIPLLLAITSIMAAMGAYTMASHIFPDAGGAVTRVMVMMGLAVGVDYSLFYLKRMRQERHSHGIDHATAIEVAAATSGRAVLMSGLAVVVSLTGLYLAHDVIFSSIATACVIMVAIALVSSLTVLPAILSKLGSRIDTRKRRATPATTGPSNRILRPATTRPAITVALASALLLALAAPGLGMKLSVEGNETFPKSLPGIAAYDEMTAAFDDEGVVHTVIARVPHGQHEQLNAAIRQLHAAVSDDPLFSAEGQPQPRWSQDGDAVALDLPIPHPASDERATRTVEKLREKLVPDTVGALPKADYGVSGEAAYATDYSQHQADRLAWVVGFVLLASFVMLLLAFRSVVIAAGGLVLNLLSVLATWGAMVLVFQGTWAEGLLDFTSPGFIGSRTPLLVFAILFGLSLDYQILVVSRIREAAQRGLPTAEAVREGVRASAGVVTSAAVIMMSVFVAFIFIDRIEMKQLGFALALGVLLDAVVVRVALLPAMMTLLGRFTWWPSRLAKITSTARNRPEAVKMPVS